MEAVGGNAKEEDNKSANHDGEERAKANSPTKILLDVADNDDGETDPNGYGEVPPVEEGAPGGELPSVVGVELICGEGKPTRFADTLRERDEIEGDIEEGHLQRKRGRRGVIVKGCRRSLRQEC